MSAALVGTALLMGLAGGPHCAAMCGAACAGFARAGDRSARRALAFQAGRLVGYTTAGGVAAVLAGSLEWLGQQAAVLRPAWTFLHLAALAWGLMLLAWARQPAWLDGAGRTVWSRVRPWAGKRGGVFGAGVLWTFMPCGLLYSALLVASLAGGFLGGAAAMAAFASASALSLWGAPHLLAWLSARADHWRRDWGTRAAGAVLAGASCWALWSDALHRIAQWCSQAL